MPNSWPGINLLLLAGSLLAAPLDGNVHALAGPASATPSLFDVPTDCNVHALAGLASASSLLAASAACAQPERAQATMVASWLTELLLDSINRELLEVCGWSVFSVCV